MPSTPTCGLHSWLAAPLPASGLAFLGLDATEEDMQAFCDYLNEGMPGEE